MHRADVLGADHLASREQSSQGHASRSLSKERTPTPNFGRARRTGPLEQRSGETGGVGQQ